MVLTEAMEPGSITVFLSPEEIDELLSPEAKAAILAIEAEEVPEGIMSDADYVAWQENFDRIIEEARAANDGECPDEVWEGVLYPLYTEDVRARQLWDSSKIIRINEIKQAEINASITGLNA